jgi:UDP-2,3-diacylglucosamine pyrophosphatase LpxH
MTTKKLNGDKPILFLGDNHGAWNDLFDIINSKSIRDCYIISVGDLGIGFKYKKEYEYSQSEKLNDMFKEKNINFFGIRGNHDNPVFFKGANKICLENFELIEDYSVFEYNSKLIQFIGGAVSIDRNGRRQGISYWENERVVFNKEACQKVDILVTHTAPSWCFPQQFNEMVYGWARGDAYLLEDLTDERSVMDEIFKICKPELHLYGHFHSSWTERVNGCVSKLLDINEMYQLV